MAVDPGGTTGVAAGYVTLADTFKDTVKTMEAKRSLEVGGDWLDQAAELCRLMHRFVFRANVEVGLPLYNVHITFEDFVLRRRREGGATGNLTSIWVAAAAVGMYHSSSLIPREGDFLVERVPVTWRQASPAKTFATDERLRMWGLWESGSAHKRDAWRHWAAHVNGLVT